MCKHKGIICILCVLETILLQVILFINTSKFMRKLLRFFLLEECGERTFWTKQFKLDITYAIYKKNTSHWDWRHLITKTWKSILKPQTHVGFHTFILIRRLMAPSKMPFSITPFRHKEGQEHLCCIRQKIKSGE